MKMAKITIIRPKAHFRTFLVFRTNLFHGEVFVIDEPMVGLDPQHARVVKDVLKERSLAGMTVLLSTHQLSIAEEMADRKHCKYGRLLRNVTV